MCVYVKIIISRVDEDRVKQVGPDRACAEWLLRCGAGVKWKGLDHYEKEYNSLPGSGFDKYKIEVIDASKSAVMGIGFPHLSITVDHFKIVCNTNNRFKGKVKGACFVMFTVYIGEKKIVLL